MQYYAHLNTHNMVGNTNDIEKYFQAMQYACPDSSVAE